MQNIVLISDVQHSDSTCVLFMIQPAWCVYKPSVIIQGNITDYIPFAAYYILVTCLFYNWKL